MAKLQRSFGLILALIIVMGAFPARSEAQIGCTAAAYTAYSASTFTLPPNTLASIAWSNYSEVVFRVPLGTQATVYSGWGSYWVYGADCPEATVEQQARDHAWRRGLVVVSIYSLPSYLVQVGGVGYYPPPVPAPPPYTPPPYSPPSPPPYTPPPFPAPDPGQQWACPAFGGQATTPLWQPIYESRPFMGNVLIGYRQTGCRYYGGRAVAQVPAGFSASYRLASPGDYRNGWQFYGSPGETIQTDAADFFPWAWRLPWP